MDQTRIIVEKNVPCEMRDGTILYADIYRPDREGKFPILLTRHPYGKDLPFYSYRYLDTNRLVLNGFIVINQDVRGRFHSEGEFDLLSMQEALDGYDTIEWAAALPYSTGKVGMFGMSYYGYTQLLAAATKPPHLMAIAPGMITNDLRNGFVYRNGAYLVALNENYALESIAPDMLKRKHSNPEERKEALKKAAAHLNNIKSLYPLTPVNQWLPLKELGVADYFYQNLLHPSEDEEFWKECSVAEKYEDLNLPAFHISGWYDCFTGPTLTNFVEMSKSGQVQKLLVGPWAHGNFASYQGECSFGVHASGDSIDLEEDITDLHIRWFNHWLKGIDQGLDKEPPVKIFVMGINEWREEMEWPLKRTEYTNFYLHSKGHGNTRNGDGCLSVNKPQQENSDRYTYDPNDPVPTRGGGTLYSDGAVGPIDQGLNEDREDVLIYSTKPLTEAIEVTGPVKVNLWASTDAKDTDFIAKLVDTAPDGRAIILTEGIVNARTHHGNVSEKELNGEIIEYEIDLWVTSNVFLPGHRITLEVSSSSFPQYLPNPNTGKSLTVSEETVKAHQVVYHSEQYPSHLILPIIPKDR
nr:CocE/NonD family hydrolase [uncultured Bacillus sp.]